MIKLLTAALLALAAPAAAQTGCLVSGVLNLETPRVGVTPAYVAANCVNRSLIKLSTAMASAADFTALSDSTEALQVALDAETAARIAADFAVGEATDTLDGDLTAEVSARQTLALLTASTTDALQVEVDGKAPLTGEGTSGTWGISVTGSAGSATGNAATATALAADGANCSAGSYPLGVDASGAAQSCTAAPEVSSATVVLNPAGFVPAGLIPTLNQNTSGNAGTATALAADGANCSAGSYPLGVDASGAAQSCTAAPEVSTATVVLNPAGFVPAGLIPTLNQNTSGNAATATALAADGANCSAGSYPLGVDASGAAQSCTAAPEVSTATVVLNPDGYVPNVLIDPSSGTKQGNVFNGADQLVKLDGTGKLPAIDGSALTGVSASGTCAYNSTHTVVRTDFTTASASTTTLITGASVTFTTNGTSRLWIRSLIPMKNNSGGSQTSVGVIVDNAPLPEFGTSVPVCHMLGVGGIENFRTTCSFNWTSRDTYAAGSHTIFMTGWRDGGTASYDCGESMCSLQVQEVCQ